MRKDLLSGPGDRAVLEVGATTYAVTGLGRIVQLVAKRVIDLLCAAVLLTLLLPVLAAVAFLVWYSSPGPVFFRQARVGQNGRVFRMHRFRTMVHKAQPTLHQQYYSALVNSIAVPVQGTYKLANDRRITRIGRSLRRFSLDELPQLWDVIKGDMSLVGPRPGLAYEVELYGTRERVRLGAKPGLTGLWQVSGSALTFQEMIDLDVYYVEHWSIWLDIWILLRTPLVLLAGRGV